MWFVKVFRARILWAEQRWTWSGVFNQKPHLTSLKITQMAKYLPPLIPQDSQFRPSMHTFLTLILRLKYFSSDQKISLSGLKRKSWATTPWKSCPKAWPRESGSRRTTPTTLSEWPLLLFFLQLTWRQQINAVTGHRSNVSIESYCERPTLHQFQHVFDDDFIHSWQWKYPTSNHVQFTIRSNQSFTNFRNSSQKNVATAASSIWNPQNDANFLLSNRVNPWAILPLGNFHGCSITLNTKVNQ